MGKEVLLILNSTHKLLGFSKEASGLPNPTLVEELNHLFVKDVACADTFIVALMEIADGRETNQIFVDFKQNNLDKIRKNLNFTKRIARRRPVLNMISKEIAESKIEHKVSTYGMDNILLKPETRNIAFKSIISPGKDTVTVDYEDLAKHVRSFFGIIDFESVPLMLLEIEKEQRKSKLKRAVQELVEDLIQRSDDFRNYTEKFREISKMLKRPEARSLSFDVFFYEQIMKDPSVKLVISQDKFLRKKKT